MRAQPGLKPETSGCDPPRPPTQRWPALLPGRRVAMLPCSSQSLSSCRLNAPTFEQASKYRSSPATPTARHASRSRSALAMRWLSASKSCSKLMFGTSRWRGYSHGPANQGRRRCDRAHKPMKRGVSVWLEPTCELDEPDQERSHRCWQRLLPCHPVTACDRPSSGFSSRHSAWISAVPAGRRPIQE